MLLLMLLLLLQGNAAELSPSHFSLKKGKPSIVQSVFDTFFKKGKEVVEKEGPSAV